MTVRTVDGGFMVKSVVVAAAFFLACLASASNAALVVDSTTIGKSVIVSSTNDVIATFESADAGYTSELSLEGRPGIIFRNNDLANYPIGTTVNLGSFAVGTELIFKLYVTNEGRSYFSGPGSRNPDDAAHAAVNTDGGLTFVGFEDIYGASDDFNDLVFSFSNTIAAAAPGVPEPASWAMMIAGFGMVGGALRARARKVQFTAA